ncbi:hypothetical protein ASA1KI_04320 [Opitutales bacterium ASA1]|nr:hypothetical protein ASA1KI_04320 [Opitutales bacterium ASA1]
MHIYASMAACAVFAEVACARASSFFTSLPHDPGTVVLGAEDFPVVGDGIADDTAAVQAAIDRVQERAVRGVVIVPEGRYRLTRTVHVWSGIRLIGVGAARPVFTLGADTPGFQEGDGRWLLHFVSYRPAPGQPIRDANPGTFYSGMSNIDIEIADGNPAAIGVRFHVAQHCFLAHMDFRIGSARAGIESIGNEVENCRFFGGEYGITTRKPSPSWPFLLIDCAFQGQRRAAIQTEEAGMTIVRAHISDTPTAIEVRDRRSEELYIEDSQFVRIAGPAIVISEENNARTQVNLANVACADVPVLARFRTSGREIAGPSSIFRVRSFSHGLHIDDLGVEPAIDTRHELEPLDRLPEPVASDVAALPPADTWVNLRDFGAVGDGEADDTEALRRAIAEHRTVFLPTGRYRMSDTVTLRPDTVLVGLSPITTQLVLADGTPAFLGEGAAEGEVPEWMRERRVPVSQGTGGPKALLETPAGGSNIVFGIGLDTGINNRAVGALWRAGERSLMHDVRFHGGHGTYRADGTAPPIYNHNRTADEDPRRRWDSQYWSLWVTDGGGGVFKNIWTPNPFAQAGMYVSNTSTRGRVYAMSVEHHVRHEVQLRDVSGWRFYALQFEEERGEGAHALPLEIVRCRDLEFVNLYLYRVMTTYSPFPTGVRVHESTDLRFRGVHVYSPSKFTFDDTLVDATSGGSVRSREIAWMNVSGRAPADGASGGDSFAGPVERLATGFNNIDSLVAGPNGDVFFIDARWQRIWRWSAERGAIELVRDHPLEPVNLAFDAAGHLLVVTRIGTVYAFDPEARDEAVTPLPRLQGPPPASARVVHPLSRWRDAHDFLDVTRNSIQAHHLSPDGGTAIPADEDFAKAGFTSSFYSTIDLIRAYGLAPAVSGRPFFVADEFGQKTWRFEVSDDGTLARPELVAEEGEGAVAVDARGRVYIPAGAIFVHDADGARLGTIDVPERPTSLAIGGPDGRTLFVGARSSLYAVRVP